MAGGLTGVASVVLLVGALLIAGTGDGLSGSSYQTSAIEAAHPEDAGAVGRLLLHQSLCR